ESDETVIFTLASGTGYTIGTTSGVTGTITNDDTQVTLTVSPSSVAEDGTTNLVYTFTRTGPTTNNLAVTYTIGGTATNGSDYNNIGTSVTFASGSSTATVTVDPTADTTPESDETVIFTLASGTGYTIGTTSGVTGTITNDDTQVTLTVSPSSVAEDGTPNLVYTFTRTGPTTNTLAVNYTIGGTATNGSDYNNIDTSVTFAAGSSTATVTVDPTADTTPESDETVIFTLGSGTGYTIGTTSGVTGTITNDDTQVTLTVSPSSVAEDGTTNLVYTFTHTGPTTNTLAVNYTIGGTATNGSDYNNIGTSVTFAAGSSTATVTVDPTADTTPESDETVIFTLGSGTGYTIGTTSGVTGTITNDDLGDNQQITSTSNRLRATPSATLTVPLLYNTSNSNNSLNGIGIRLHYDSSDLSYQQVTNLLSTNLFGAVSDNLDNQNFDKDNTTDRYIQIQYFAPNGNWPNKSLPVKLGDFAFTTSTNFQETQLNITSVSASPGYTLEAAPIEIYKQNWTLDVDGNYTSDALSDGIIIMRYLFGNFPGDALTRNAIAPNATRTSSEIRTYLGEAGSILDIDGDGKVTPLSDGIMAVRYLFGGTFTGNALINGAISPNATRNLSQIESYLASISGTSSVSPLVRQQTTFLPLFAQTFNATSSSKQIIDLTTSNSSLTPGAPVSIGVTYNVDSGD
ncbi:beta strand repeat-containing protein, partial [Cylindrospermopsis raciborskii]